MSAVYLSAKANKQKLSAFADITFVDHFPDKNPANALDDIVNSMHYAGLFEGINVTTQ